MAANPIITMLSKAYSQLGTPYVFGAQDPNTAFDCSGLTAWAAQSVGVNLIHQARQQAEQLRSLSRGELRPGDLVFFSYGRLGSAIDHVGIYIGGGKMIDTSNPDSDLKVTDVDWDNFVQGGDMYAAIGPGAEVPTAKRLNSLAERYNVDRYVSRDTVAGQAAARAQGKQNSAMPGYLAAMLKTYGLDPNAFKALINQAVVNGWTDEQFKAEVYATPEFTNTFPGIFNNDGSLKMSPIEYQNLVYGPNGYADVAREYGIKFDRDRFGALIGKNVSPSEWAFRNTVVQQAKATEPFRQAFNKQLALVGQKELGPKEWAEFIEGKSNRFVEKLYMASSLDAARGVDLTGREARRVAGVLTNQGILDPMQAGLEVDPAQLVAAIRAYGDQVGPELQQAGITDADLALLEAGVDNRNIGLKVQTIMRNRGALGPGGGFRTSGTKPTPAGAL